MNGKRKVNEGGEVIQVVQLWPAVVHAGYEKVDHLRTLQRSRLTGHCEETAGKQVLLDINIQVTVLSVFQNNGVK